MLRLRSATGTPEGLSAMRNESLTPEAVSDSLIGCTPTVSPANARHADGTLVDRYGRHVSYLRLSITDRCDFRCGYCMAEEMTFLPRAQVLTLEECLRIASVFVDLGVTKVRVTGGEPLVRQNAVWLLEQLAPPAGFERTGDHHQRFATRTFCASPARCRRQTHQPQPRYAARRPLPDDYAGW
jgi:hypothetical protein